NQPLNGRQNSQVAVSERANLKKALVVMAKSAILTLLILLSGATGCRLFASKNLIIGDYLVSGWDKSGQLDFTGRLSFTSITEGQLKGQCKVKKVGEPFKDVLYKDGPCGGSLNGEKLI